MSVDLGSLYMRILDDETIDPDRKRELLDDVRKLVDPADNRWNIWYVLWTLMALALSVPVAAIFLDGNIPEPLVALGSASVGALATFLNPPRRGRSLGS